MPFGRCLHVLRKICGTRKVFPSGCELSGKLSIFAGTPVVDQELYSEKRGSLSDSTEVCIKSLRPHGLSDQEKSKEVSSSHSFLLTSPSLISLKLLFKEAVVWKHLQHPNIVPFKGVTLDPPQLISEWMPGGELQDYVKKNPSANLIGLVGPFLCTFTKLLTLLTVAGYRRRSCSSPRMWDHPRGSERGVCRSSNCSTVFHAGVVSQMLSSTHPGTHESRTSALQALCGILARL